MKAFRHYIDNASYFHVYFAEKSLADWLYCILNSTLFYCFWEQISDCWHVLRDLNGFHVIRCPDKQKASSLAQKLDDKLEQTKHYIGSVQTDYEYKHKLCLKEIYAIDAFVNDAYGITKEESNYLYNYQRIYRLGLGGTDIIKKA